MAGLHRRDPGSSPAQALGEDEHDAIAGSCPRGQRLLAAVPHGHWKTSTFIGALRCDGFVAPAVFEGAINGDLFLDYVEQILVPTPRPGDIVIMDKGPILSEAWE
jgi:hypothetical protein